MRKDVRRSLLLWPAAASITITAATWFPTKFLPEPWIRPTLLDSLTAPPSYDAFDRDSVAVENEIAITSRTERGARAMCLPPRVAEAFGVAPRIIKAPECDEKRELAGLVLQTPRESARSAHQLAKDILDGDVTAADRFVNPESLGSDWALVQSLRQRQSVASSSSTFRSASMLPRSTRIMGRPSSDSSQVVDARGRDLMENEIGLGDTNSIASSPNPFSTARYFPLHMNEADPEVQDERVEEPHRQPTTTNPASWPETTRLDEQLKELSAMAMNARPNARDQLVSYPTADPDIAKWTDQVSLQLESLRALPRLGDPRAGELIEQLSTLAEEGETQAESLSDRQQQSRWLSTAHAVARRVAVWRLVWQVTRDSDSWVGDRSADSASDSASGAILEQLLAVRGDLQETGDVEGWTRYLLLDEIEAAAASGEPESRLILSQRLLTRLTWHRLDAVQSQWLRREPVMQLAESIRPWAQDAVDYAALMRQIELQERDASDLSASNVAGSIQKLRYADHPGATQIASAIDTHYRNANVRVAIRSELLQRLVPQPEARSVPVNAVILGSRVRGTSQVETDLGIQLIPTPDRWKLRLNTTGNVTTLSTGVRSSVAVRTRGQANYQSGTEIEISANDVTIRDTEASANGATRLRGIETEFDGWPLLGPLVQSIAESQYQRLSPQANRIANRTLEQRIENEVDQQLNERVVRATDQLTQVLLGPLGRLQLDPKVTDMQTTQERLTARFRVAGDWQLAAYTPRPRAPGASLMSVQVHQSAINNTVEQLIPRGESLGIQELIQQIAQTFGQTDVSTPDDLPSDVTIQFSKTRPITVEIEEDRLWITLRILRLKRADSVDLTQFIVRAAYRPQVDGFNAGLVRDEHLRISGPNLSMRERLPVRTIFNKVFSPNREIPLTVPKLRQNPAMEGLVVSQLELRDGWLAMAIEEANEPRVAHHIAGGLSPTGNQESEGNQASGQVNK